MFTDIILLLRIDNAVTEIGILRTVIQGEGEITMDTLNNLSTTIKGNGTDRWYSNSMQRYYGIYTAKNSNG